MLKVQRTVVAHAGPHARPPPQKTEPVVRVSTRPVDSMQPVHGTKAAASSRTVGERKTTPRLPAIETSSTRPSPRAHPDADACIAAKREALRSPSASDGSEAALRIFAMLERERAHTPRDDPFARADGPTLKVRRDWRVWFYRLVDAFDLCREIAWTASAYLDRFVLTDAGASALRSRREFGIAAVTALFLAIKVHEETVAISLDFLARKLSRGAITADEVLAKEPEFLAALDWRVHPPTPMGYIDDLLTFLPRVGSDSGAVLSRRRLRRRARELTELSILDPYFTTQRASSVALAAVSIAVDEALRDAEWGAEGRAIFLRLADCRMAERAGVGYRRVESGRWVRRRLAALRHAELKRALPRSTELAGMAVSR